MDGAEHRRRLVALLRERGALHDAAVERAFLVVPREVFVPGLSLDEVYRDDAILTKVEDGVGVSSSSQPAIMSLMLEQLDLFPGARVLEIGAGTGYNAAIVREIVGESGDVVTIDIDAEVAGWASERLKAAGYSDVLVVCADGADGWPERAPYDRIELTVAADDVALAWREQLVEDGILVVPLWIRTGQVSAAFERRGEAFHSRSVQPCGFIALRGRMAATYPLTEIAGGVVATVDAAAAPMIRALMRQPQSSTAWPGRSWDGFSFIVGLWDVPVFTIWAAADASPVFHGGGFALLDDERNSLAIVSATSDAAGLQLLSYGSSAASERLLGAYERWEALGHPDVDQLEIAAFPLERAPERPADRIAIDTRMWRLIIGRNTGGPIY
jgi:protein-L-isoaspartate(D-aspartate) O-methyltransferase